MPRNVRNFWLTLEVDGKKSRVATGPIGKDGGFSLMIRQRQDGDISDKTVRVVGQADGNGKLRLFVNTAGGGKYAEVLRVETER